MDVMDLTCWRLSSSTAIATYGDLLCGSISVTPLLTGIASVSPLLVGETTVTPLLTGTIEISECC